MLYYFIMELANDIDIFPVIVCIAKLEHNYIEEFVLYHLSIGFRRIYLFENDDIPTYAHILHKYVDTGKVYVCHFPRNNHYIKEDNQNHYIPVQYLVLHIFAIEIMPDPQITHVAHIDIDEFIVLKKHRDIKNFIREYIKDDCAGIGMNWRFFGSSHNIDSPTQSVTQRFTMCGEKGDKHIKTIFRKDCFARFDGCHTIKTTSGHIKSTDGTIIEGPFNKNAPIDVVQINHYKCKTLEEYRYIRTRQRADVVGQAQEDVDNDFKKYDINEVEDLTARNLYRKMRA